MISLDALRGIAVMGILAMNILAFGMPGIAYLSPAIVAGDGNPGDLITWWFSFILIEGKMRGLFSLLFGASMMLIIERSWAREELGFEAIIWRHFWLAIFGIAHFILIWHGDILFLYAIMGSLAFLFRRKTSRQLVKWAIGIGLFGFLFLLGLLALPLISQIVATQPGASAELIAEYQSMLADTGATSAAIAEESARMLGSYPTILFHRLSEEWVMLVFLPILLFGETLPMILLGMALMKSGFMSGDLPAWHYRKYIIYGLIPGAIGYIALGGLLMAKGFEALWANNIVFGWSAPFRFAMTLGYAALFLLLIRKFQSSALIHRIAAAGRCAFSNYLGTSLLMTFIFYGYGLGLFGKVHRPLLYLLVAGAWALMLLWSLSWLRYFHYGPFEWLWRSLARRKVQPLKRV